MATQKISNLTAISAPNESDLLAVVDVDENVTKQITLSQVLRTQHPTVPVWDDLRFPASNSSSIDGFQPSVESETGLLLFSATFDRKIGYLAQLPHWWKEGSTIKPHVHWQKTTSEAGNVLWRLGYKWAPIGEVMDASFSILSSATPAVSDADTADVGAITALGDIDATGKTISDMLVMVFSRLGSDALDTYGEDARLLEFDLHIQRDGNGSTEEFTK